MAVRYSGDVTLRLRYVPRLRAYEGTVRWPGGGWDGTVGRAVPPRGATSSEAYDRTARLLAYVCERETRALRRSPPFVRERGRIAIVRMFQAPCPTGIRLRSGGR